VDAARFFEAENHKALDDSRTRLLVGDGRTHLALARERYDVIVSEPSNPWMAGIASLFTREFFQAAKDRLQPGGVLCQWAHTYDMSTADLQSIVATFLSVFPDGTLWLVGDGDVLLVGSTDSLESRIAAVPETWTRPRVSEDLASVGAKEPFHVLSLFVARGAALVRWAAGAPIQTDDRSALEFSGPLSAFGAPAGDNAVLLRTLAAEPDAAPAAITQTRGAATAADIRDRGLMFLTAEAARPAYADLVRAVEAAPDDPAALDGLIRASAANQTLADTESLLRRLASDPARRAAKLGLSRLLASRGAFEEAAQIAMGVLQGDPRWVPALEQLASILSDVGDVERMKPVVARLRNEAPASEGAHYYAAALLFMEGRLDLALAEARQTVAVNPRNAKAHNLIGATLASMGQRDRAREAFLTSMALDPRDPGTYTNLGTLEQEAGNLDRAEQYFVEALMADPRSEAARRGLDGLNGRTR
jgi:spermidine synthase